MSVGGTPRSASAASVKKEARKAVVGVLRDVAAWSTWATEALPWHHEEKHELESQEPQQEFYGTCSRRRKRLKDYFARMHKQLRQQGDEGSI